MDKQTFLITGAARGLGLALAEAALAAGHTVAATVRSEADRASVEALAPGRAHAYLLDMAELERIEPMVKAIEAEVGPIDVLINNAGYGHEGVLEESPLEAMIRQFDVNVFAGLAMIKAVLPGMRERRRGHIFNVASIAGLIAMPGIAYYTASKYAMVGISGVLAQEVKSFGVKVTCLEPGPFRTGWAGASLDRTERSISDYDAMFTPVREARQAKDGQQPGDPSKLAQAVLTVLEAEDPPVNLVLGRYGLGAVREGTGRLLAELEQWEDLSLSTDYQ